MFDFQVLLAVGLHHVEVAFGVESLGLAPWFQLGLGSYLHLMAK